MQRMTGFEVTRKRDNRLEKDVLPTIVLFNEKKIFLVRWFNHYIPTFAFDSLIYTVKEDMITKSSGPPSYLHRWGNIQTDRPWVTSL